MDVLKVIKEKESCFKPRKYKKSKWWNVEKDVRKSFILIEDHNSEIEIDKIKIGIDTSIQVKKLYPFLKLEDCHIVGNLVWEKERGIVNVNCSATKLWKKITAIYSAYIKTWALNNETQIKNNYTWR